MNLKSRSILTSAPHSSSCYVYVLRKGRPQMKAVLLVGNGPTEEMSGKGNRCPQGPSPPLLTSNSRHLGVVKHSLSLLPVLEGSVSNRKLSADFLAHCDAFNVRYSVYSIRISLQQYSVTFSAKHSYIQGPKWWYCCLGVTKLNSENFSCLL